MDKPRILRKDHHPASSRTSLKHIFTRSRSRVLLSLSVLLVIANGVASTADAKLNIYETEGSRNHTSPNWSVGLSYTSACQKKVSAQLSYNQPKSVEVDAIAKAKKLAVKSVEKLQQQCAEADELYVTLTEGSDVLGFNKEYGVLRKSNGWKYEDRKLQDLKAQENAAALSLTISGGNAVPQELVVFLQEDDKLSGFVGWELGGTVSEMSVVQERIENSENYLYRVSGYMESIGTDRTCEKARNGVYNWGAFELKLFQPEVNRSVNGVYVSCGALGQARRTDRLIVTPAPGPGTMPMPHFDPVFYKKLFSMIERAAAVQKGADTTRIAFEPLVRGQGYTVVPQEAGWCGAAMRLGVYYDIKHADRQKVLGDSYQDFVLNKVVRRIKGACPTAELVELKNFRVGETEPYDTYLYRITDSKNRQREAYGGGKYYAREEYHLLSAPMAQRLYERSCMACHETGAGGAPTIGGAGMKRIGTNQVMVEESLNGAKRDPGMHFGRFHCHSCSWSDLIALTRHMSTGKRNSAIRQIADLPDALQPLARYAAAPSVKSLLDSGALDISSPYIYAIYEGRYRDVEPGQRGAVTTHFTDFLELYSYYCGESYQGQLKSHQMTYVERKDEWDAVYLTEKRSNLVKIPAQYYDTYVKYAGNFAVTGWFDPDESDGGLKKLQDRGLLISGLPGSSIVSRKIGNALHRTEEERALLSFARKDRAQCNDPSLLKYMDNLAGYVQ